MHLTYNGQDVEFEDFDGGELIKVNLNSTGDPNGEGIWAMLRPEDKKTYDNDESHGELVVASLRNTSFSGIPWGSFIIAETRGSKRPVCNLSHMQANKETLSSALATAKTGD
jgi:hypothetical protein